MGSLRYFVLSVLICFSALEFVYANCDNPYTPYSVLEESLVSINNVVDQNGEWETTVTTNLDPRLSSNNTNIDVKRIVLDTGGEKKVQIKVILKGSFEQYQREKLRFHYKGAKNIVVSNEGKTATRINEYSDEGFGGLLTNRPLMNDEVFEVRIKKLISKYKTSLGIGTTYHNHQHTDYNSWMMCGTKILYNNQLYESGTVTKGNIGPNLRTLNVGDRVGVVKKSNGNLHFLVNGKDLGAAASGITYPVYGVLDLFGNAVEVTLE